MNEPILGKNRSHGWDYKPITWGAFLKLRKAAQATADAIGYPVYLVGSALSKELPRDIDISIIVPLEFYEKEIGGECGGKWPKDIQAQYGFMYHVDQKAFKYTHHLHHCIDYHLDIKVCPDIWWTEKPKLLLAEPKRS